MDFIKNNIKNIVGILLLIIFVCYLTGCSGVSQAFREGYVEGHNATAPTESRIMVEEERVILCPESPDNPENCDEGSTPNSTGQPVETQGEGQ